MKIGNPADKPAPLSTAASGPNATVSAADAAKTQHAAAAIPAAADASAKIELSSTAASLLSGSQTAEFDAEKVARVSKAIDDGSYKINAEVIADKLIANAQELLSKTGAGSS